MEQDPDITYSRFNKRFFHFLWTPLAIFRFRGRPYLYLFLFLFLFFYRIVLWDCFGGRILTQFPVQVCYSQ